MNRVALKQFAGRLLIVTLMVIIFYSCRKDDEPVYDYFISKELKLSYSASTIRGLLDAASASYPELSELKAFVDSDVDVYKLVYRTNVGGEDIKASGLVCIPKSAGSYPLFSFQNGTNTVNSYAPTKFVANPSYQMIQFVASMGFVVLIPDYPGFGESDDIPHPYLVKEHTVIPVTDMFRAVREACSSEFAGIVITDEVYLAGYSQGGWATLALHKSLEKDFNQEFSLAGSVCGAGPYNLFDLLAGMLNSTEYPMPSYLGYIINAYSEYKQFSNQVTDIINEPYATRLPGLYNGLLSLDQINSQLTTSIPLLLNQDFLSGFTTSPEYSSVREALVANSIPAWNTSVPVFFIHGEGDTHVSVDATNSMYEAMIGQGSSPLICRKLILPLLDHGEAIVPALTEGMKFLIEIKESSR